MYNQHSYNYYGPRGYSDSNISNSSKMMNPQMYNNYFTPNPMMGQQSHIPNSKHMPLNGSVHGLPNGGRIPPPHHQYQQQPNRPPNQYLGGGGGNMSRPQPLQSNQYNNYNPPNYYSPQDHHSKFMQDSQISAYRGSLDHNYHPNSARMNNHYGQHHHSGYPPQEIHRSEPNLRIQKPPQPQKYHNPRYQNYHSLDNEISNPYLQQHPIEQQNKYMHPSQQQHHPHHHPYEQQNYGGINRGQYQPPTQHHQNMQHYLQQQVHSKSVDPIPQNHQYYSQHGYQAGGPLYSQQHESQSDRNGYAHKGPQHDRFSERVQGTHDRKQTPEKKHKHKKHHDKKKHVKEEVEPPKKMRNLRTFIKSNIREDELPRVHDDYMADPILEEDFQNEISPSHNNSHKITRKLTKKQSNIYNKNTVAQRQKEYQRKNSNKNQYNRQSSYTSDEQSSSSQLYKKKPTIINKKPAPIKQQLSKKPSWKKQSSKEMNSDLEEESVFTGFQMDRVATKNKRHQIASKKPNNAGNKIVSQKSKLLHDDFSPISKKKENHYSFAESIPGSLVYQGKKSSNESKPSKIKLNLYSKDPTPTNKKYKKMDSEAFSPKVLDPKHVPDYPELATPMAIQKQRIPFDRDRGKLLVNRHQLKKIMEEK